MDQTNHTLIIEGIQKSTYVWFEENWIHDDELHSHRKGQLIYVEQGFQYLTVAGKMYLLPQNHVAWIPPQFDSSQEHLFFNQVQLFSAPKVLREMILYTEKWSKLREENEQERVFLGALLHELPYFCSQLLHLEITLPHESRLQTVLNHLHDHYTEAITLDEIAMLSNLSLRTIERLFKKETGMTLAKYQQLLLINQEFGAFEHKTIHHLSNCV